MSTLRRFRQLSGSEQYACCAAALLLLSAKLLLQQNQFDSARRRTRALAHVLHVLRPRPDLITAVARAARHVPWQVTCLHEAIAAEAMLKRAGYECTLCIGARSGAHGHEFHAWLSAGPEVLLGESDSHALLYCAR